MAVAAEVTQEPWQWITKLVIFSIFTIIQFFILKSEIKRRQTFSTKWFKLLSLICIASGFIGLLFLSLQFIPILCVVCRYIGYIIVGIQAAAMGFYQLHRLHYCFANKEIHSKQAYPKCLFQIMFSIGIVLGINNILSIIFFGDNIRLNCGINGSTQFYFDKIDSMKQYKSLASPSESMFVLGTFLYQLWDVFTILLYIRQIFKFRKHKESVPLVYKSVMETLYKIVILTLFYQLSVLFVTILLLTVDPINPELGDTLNALAGGTLSFSLSYSMYLMMDHNKIKYVSFTKIMHAISLYWIFCFCCKDFISDQLKEDIKSLEDVTQKDENDSNQNKGSERSVYETRDITGDHETGAGNPMELSVETATIMPSSS